MFEARDRSNGNLSNEYRQFVIVESLHFVGRARSIAEEFADEEAGEEHLFLSKCNRSIRLNLPH